MDGCASGGVAEWDWCLGDLDLDLCLDFDGDGDLVEEWDSRGVVFPGVESALAA